MGCGVRGHHFCGWEGNEIFRRQEACWDPQIIRFGFFGLANHQALFVRKRTYERLGGLRYKDFKNCCDFEFMMRMAKNHCKVGHIREYVVRYRYHQFGQSADRRITANMKREVSAICKEYGTPRGLLGWLLQRYARIQTAGAKTRAAGQMRLGTGPLVFAPAHAEPHAVFLQHRTG